MIDAASALAALRAFPVRPLDDVLARGPLLVLSPHPDDESLGCGGIIAACAASGRHVEIALLTDGAGSHPNSPRYPANRLAALREAEMREAIAHLGLSRSGLHPMRLPDRRAPHEGFAFERAAARLADLLISSKAATLLTTWIGDPHADHVAASLIARRAARVTQTRLLEFPVWGWTLPPDAPLPIEPPRGARIDVRASLPAKRAAIAAHRSQTTGLIDDDPSGFRLPSDFIGLFTGSYETLVHD